MEKERIHPLQGLAVLIICLVLLFFAGSWVQIKFGLYGLMITELGVMLLGVLSAILTHQDLKEVFPIRRPELREAAAALLLWGGCFAAVSMIMFGLLLLFPKQVLGTGQGISEFVSGYPGFLTFFVAAVMPAVCEEALCRGFLQHSLKGIKNEAAVVLVMAVYFGVLHLDPVRFLSTAVLGAGLSYLMLRTRNLLLPVLFHLTNNAFSVLVSLLGAGAGKAAAESGGSLPLMEMTASGAMAGMGLVMMIFFLLPACLTGAVYLLKDREERAGMGKQKMIYLFTAAALSVLMFIVGLVFVIVGGIYGGLGGIS